MFIVRRVMLWLPLFVTLAVPVFLLAWQVYYYLQTEIWVPVTLQMALERIGLDIRWDSTAAPTAGLADVAEILQWTTRLPLSGTLLILGCAFLFVLSRLRQS